MLILTLALLQAAAAPQASNEADALGVRLARTSELAVLAPAVIEKDLAELAAEDPSLTEAERKRLIEMGRKEGSAGVERLVHALGREYTRRLSLEDLRQLVALEESPAAGRRRAAEPAVIMGAMQALGSIDMKKDVAAAFCRDTRKLCNRD